MTGGSDMDDLPPLLLLGAGSMGSALLRGWVESGIPPSRIAVRDPDMGAEIASFIEMHGIGKGDSFNSGACIFALKPDVLDAALAEFAPQLRPQTVVLSVAAGRTLANIESRLPQGAAVVRSMPNIPAEIGHGMTVAIANGNVSPPQSDLCEMLLQAVGEVAWIEDESLMDAVTAVSGSGPAYVFYLVECLEAAGRAAGLPSDLALRLARETVAGAADMLDRSSLRPDALRSRVTSPGGTTSAALAVLSESGGLASLLQKAVEAAAQRSRELSQ